MINRINNIYCAKRMVLILYKIERMMHRINFRIKESNRLRKNKSERYKNERKKRREEKEI